MLILVWVVSIVVIGIVVVLVLAAGKPNVCRVQRSTNIKADAAKVFPFIDDFRHWPAWSPFEKLDRNMTKTYSGPPLGKGATFEWSGNKKAGAGRAEIIGSTPPEKVVIRLNFSRPFKAQNTAQFTLVPQGNSTQVTWSMEGQAAFIIKIMHVFLNLDKMIGKDFAEGLNNLKVLAEK